MLRYETQTTRLGDTAIGRLMLDALHAIDPAEAEEVAHNALDGSPCGEATDAPAACECDWQSCRPGCPHVRPLSELQAIWRRRAEARREAAGYCLLAEIADALRVRRLRQRTAYVQSQAGADRDAEARERACLETTDAAIEFVGQFREDLKARAAALADAMVRNVATFVEANGSWRDTPEAVASAQELAALLRRKDAALLL